MGNTIDMFHQACKLVVDNQDKEVLNWAVNYAKRGLLMIEWPEIRTQSMYILNNIKYWRGKDATLARKLLKRVIHLTS